MDQHAFRQLLGTPQKEGDEAVGNGSTSGASALRAFGKQLKRGVPTGHAGPSVLADFRPRKHSDRRDKDHAREQNSSQLAKNSATGEAYVDRAEARRSGKNDSDDFANVEQLRADFERRIGEAASEEERRAIREQMLFLGGDAKHSVLVKGLDFALLEQQKAKLSGKEADDDDLEAAYGNEAAKEDASRPERQEQHSGESNMSKFRPIGQSNAKAANGQAGEAPEYIWKNGKRYRKKQKVGRKADDASSLPAAERTQGDNSRAKAEAHHDSASPRASPKGTREVVSQSDHQRSNFGTKTGSTESTEEKRPSYQAEDAQHKPQEPDGLIMNLTETSADPESIAIERRQSGTPSQQEQESDGDDIFAGAGRWEGIDGDDSDSEGQANACAPVMNKSLDVQQSAKSGAPKHDWFATSKPTDRSSSEHDDHAADTIGDVLQQAHQAAGVNEGVPYEEDQQQAKNVASSPPLRLAGFSDSAFDIRSLLEAKDDKGEHSQQRHGDGKKRSRRRKRAAGGDDSE